MAAEVAEHPKLQLNAGIQAISRELRV